MGFERETTERIKKKCTRGFPKTGIVSVKVGQARLSGRGPWGRSNQEESEGGERAEKKSAHNSNAANSIFNKGRSREADSVKKKAWEKKETNRGKGVTVQTPRRRFIY